MQNKRDLDRAVTDFEPKIAELEGAPHELVEQMDAWKVEISEIAGDVDLSGVGKAKRLAEIKQRIDSELSQLDAAFHRDFETCDGALAHLQNQRNGDGQELLEPPDFLRFDAEKELWRQNALLEKRLAGLETLLTQQHRQNILKDELQTMTAGEIVQRADIALKANDKATLEILKIFGKRRVQEVGDASAMGRLNKIIDDYEDSVIPAHAKAAVKQRARLAKARAEWRTRLQLVKNALA